LTETRIETIRLLVVSQESAVLRLFYALEEANGWHLEAAASGWDAMEQVQSGPDPDLLVLDIARSDSDNLRFLRWLRRLRPELPVLALCQPRDAASGKEATPLGADETLMRPFDQQQLESAIRIHLGSGAGPADTSNGNEPVDIIGENVEQLSHDCCFVSASPLMQKLRAQAALLAQTDVPVLILGETGTGKYTVASLIHKLSVRSGFKLLVVNCAEMPEALLAAELFGDHRDSASRRWSRPGKFGAGEKITIFLDEIAAMPAALQSRLLQVLQHSEFRGAAGSDPMPGDVRILAASSSNLERALAEKRLREDLYYRLSAFTVHVPPLRQRKEEIGILLEYFMHKLAKRFRLPAREFSPAVLDACQGYAWPGNLKELETFVKRHLVTEGGELNLSEMGSDAAVIAGNASLPYSARLTVALPGPGSPKAGETKPGATKPWYTKSGLQKPGSPEAAEPESLKSLIQGIKSEAEQSAIAAALQRTGWNRKAAARLLRVSYRTLLYKIEQYHMRAPEPYLSPLPAGNFSWFDSEVKSEGK
jgi:two-component system response regulator AtoC